MAAATTITVQEINEPFSVISAGDADFTLGACDEVNGNDFACTGKEIIVFNNPSGGALTVTISSVNDEKNRDGDITDYSIGASEFAVFGVGLTNSQGWKDSSGKITFTASSADLDVAVLRLP